MSDLNFYYKPNKQAIWRKWNHFWSTRFPLKRRKLCSLVWERLKPEVLWCCLRLFLLKMQPIKNSEMPHSFEIKVAPVHFRELGLYLHVDVSAELYVKNNKCALTAPEWSFYNSFQAMWCLCWYIQACVCVCVCTCICNTVRTRICTSLSKWGQVCKMRIFCLRVTKGCLRDKMGW